MKKWRDQEKKVAQHCNKRPPCDQQVRQRDVLLVFRFHNSLLSFKQGFSEAFIIMDDLFALIEEDDDLFIQQDNATQRSEPEQVDSLQPVRPLMNIQERLSSSIDAKIGIRILNRKISGAEMIDMISASVYRSPALLSAMSLEDLNNHILADPTMVVDASTVCGRTNFCSVGIVFSNSGTRTSSTGNAFCALTLGNFATGPAIGVLLFGTAYSKYVRTLTPGKVVLLENPRLIPSNRNSSDRKETSISFSVSNEREIQLVGDAQDFGICKGTVRGKNENGQWVDNAKRCRAYVDTRQCLYCKLHQQQRNVVDKSGSKMEKLRNEARECPSQTKFPVNRAGLDDNLQKPTNPARAMLQSAARPSVGSSLRAYHLSETTQRQQAKSSNPLLQDCSVKKPTILAQTATISRNIQKAPPKVTPLPSRKFAPNLLIKKAPPIQKKADQELLDRISGARPNGNKRKLASVNTDTGHFDGQVLVPKAKQFVNLDRERVAALQAKQQKPTLEVGTKSQSDILLRQKQVAEQMRNNRGEIKGQPLKPKQNLLLSKKKSSVLRQTNGSDLFASMGKEELARVMAARSRFADEADAEEYARARHAVTELEKEEYKTMSKEKKQLSKKANQQSAIKTQYFCVHCKRHYMKVPPVCRTMQHTIRIDRKIQATKTTAEERMILSAKSVEDGGVLLAQGLDWDRRFSS